MTLGLGYTSARHRMERARTPMGTVPISTIWGYDYPFYKEDISDGLSRYDAFKDRVDNIVRQSRAFSESRITDPYYTSLSPLSKSSLTSSTIPSSIYGRHKDGYESYSYSTTPWNATGFYYSPRYPEAYRGTSSTTSPYYRRYYSDYDYLSPYSYPSYRYNWNPSRYYYPSLYSPYRYPRYYY